MLAMATVHVYDPFNHALKIRKYPAQTSFNISWYVLPAPATIDVEVEMYVINGVVQATSLNVSLMLVTNPNLPR